MPPLPAQEVFTPGGFPRYTYVAQRNHEYEAQLRDGLTTSGILISILGPSKSGKAVLVEKVVADRAVRIDGAEVSSADYLWERVVARIGRALERSTSAEETKSSDLGTEVEAKGGIPFIVEARAATSYSSGGSKSGAETLRYAPAGLDEAIRGRS